MAQPELFGGGEPAFVRNDFESAGFDGGFKAT